MKKRKLGIIGGSGLYKMEGFEKAKWKKIKTSSLLTVFAKEVKYFNPFSRLITMKPNSNHEGNLNGKGPPVDFIVVDLHSEKF